jgi:hypothetical protein
MNCVRQLLALVAVVTALSDGAWAESVPERADRFLELLKSTKFEAAAAAFHYPPTYTREELAKHRAGVPRFLRGLFKEVGALRTVKRSTNPSAHVHLAIGGGDLRYWSSHPEPSETVMVSYEATAKRDGAVFMDIVFLSGKRASEIRSFQFGIPLSRPGAEGRTLDLSRNLFSEAREGSANTALERTTARDGHARAGRSECGGGSTPGRSAFCE